VAKDVKQVAAVRKQIEPLRDAWHQAAKAPVDAGA
jgi:flagellin-specific chaperone FliS